MDFITENYIQALDASFFIHKYRFCRQITSSLCNIVSRFHKSAY